jgi:hypothetical protein
MSKAVNLISKFNLSEAIDHKSQKQKIIQAAQELKKLVNAYTKHIANTQEAAELEDAVFHLPEMARKLPMPKKE